jgi:hypothetical protein
MTRHTAPLVPAAVAGLLGLLVSPSPLSAANRFYMVNETLHLGSSGNVLSVFADLDQDVFALSIHLRYDESRIRVTSVEAGAATAALDPEYDEGVAAGPGEVVHGMVFDLEDPIDKRLTPGTGMEIFRLTVDVVSPSAASAALTFENDAEAPWHRNVVTDANGISVPSLGLVSATLTLSDLSPSITSFTGNSGAPGKEFVVSGSNLDQPGRTVTVGGQAAAATLVGSTLRVTAPSCTASGPVAVEVCTIYGCDADPAGFTYDCPLPPVIESLSGATGGPGTIFTITGRELNRPGRAVTVGGRAAQATLLPGGATLQVTAPGCDGTGPVEVEVCTVHGCDAEPAGFTYNDCPGPPVIDQILGGAGVPGTVFQVLGRELQRPGRAVRVGGRAAQAALRADGITLDVTAPACSAEGVAAVEVSTDFGSDSEAAGFDYTGGCDGSSPPPVIVAIAGGAGRPGTVFQVSGESFGAPGLTVTVGGRTAQAALRADGVTLDVTAPACSGDGPATVRVCTDFGCDSEPAGFDYDCPGPPVIESLADNAGGPGAIFRVTGEEFDESGLAVRVGGRAAQATLLPDGVTLEVTAPACDADGLVEVEVCNDFGCDSEPAGFHYDCPGPPVIESILGASGGPGTVFTVIGAELNRPGLQVTVGGSPAAFTLLGDGATLRVTAPDCDATATAALEVCTSLGCDSEESGFEYTMGCADTSPPVITGLSGNNGPPGTVFRVLGRSFGAPDLAVRVGGAAPDAFVLVDGMTVEVTAPACAAIGPAPVEVCTRNGCDSEPFGFLYSSGCEAEVGPFVRGDINGDGEVPGSTTDIVFLANFLFLGGAEPPCRAAADVNGDGGVPGSTTDIVFLANFLFLGGAEPPAPGPRECGPGNAEDAALGCEAHACRDP